jgi:arylsulfatase A-like enzyme
MKTRFTLLLVACACITSPLFAANADQPNIILINADDLGYGDTSCYGATKVSTPNIDRLAREGLRFTQAHTTSATCTPSRYALLTGKYPWRRSDAKILPGDARMLIAPGTPTIPATLQKAGYATAVVGKWHLGLGDEKLDWNGEIKPGPLELGFSYSFLLPATGDRVPCVYVENHRVVGLDPKDPIVVRYDQPLPNEPTGKKNPELLKQHPSHGHDMAIVNGVSRIGYMSGGKSALWVDEDMADVFAKKVDAFIERNRAKPFFIYYATHDIHVPRVPHSRFVGKSGLGLRGDAILQFDWAVGQVMATLERLGLTQNTILIVTSDNGAVVDDGYKDQAVEKLSGHRPNGPLRGGKYSAFEAGTRVPLVIRWPAKIKPGVSSALVSQVDFAASFAALVKQPVPAGGMEDSRNALAALLGTDTKGRDHLIEHSANGRLGVRTAEWKYIEPGPGPAKNPNTDIELGNSATPQLYNLKSDPGETKNIAEQNAAKVEELKALLAKARGA